MNSSAPPGSGSIQQTAPFEWPFERAAREEQKLAAARDSSAAPGTTPATDPLPPAIVYSVGSTAPNHAERSAKPAMIACSLPGPACNSRYAVAPPPPYP